MRGSDGDLPRGGFLPRPAISPSPISSSASSWVDRGPGPGDTFAAAEQSASLPRRSERHTGPYKTPLIPAPDDDHARGVNPAHGNVAGPVTSNENARCERDYARAARTAPVGLTPTSIPRTPASLFRP